MPSRFSQSLPLRLVLYPETWKGEQGQIYIVLLAQPDFSDMGLFVFSQFIYLEWQCKTFFLFFSLWDNV